jgi:hypothetical protein
VNPKEFTSANDLQTPSDVSIPLSMQPLVLPQPREDTAAVRSESLVGERHGPGQVRGERCNGTSRALLFGCKFQFNRNLKCCSQRVRFGSAFAYDATVLPWGIL